MHSVVHRGSGACAITSRPKEASGRHSTEDDPNENRCSVHRAPTSPIPDHWVLAAFCPDHVHPILRHAD